MQRFTATVCLVALGAFAADAPGDQPWPRHTIHDKIDGLDGARGRDIDGDGDVDFVSGAEQGGLTQLYLNPGPKRAAEPWPCRAVGRTKNVEDALLVDLDKDGVYDVFSSCEGPTNKLYVHWGPANSDYMKGEWTQAQVPSPGVVPANVEWMFAEVLGDRLVVGGKYNSQLGLLTPNPDTPRDLNTWKYENLINIGWTMSIIVHDMDGDGDKDILLSDRRGGGLQRGVHWLENGNRWASHAVGVDNADVMFIDIGDINGDGYDDIAAPYYKGKTSVLQRHFGDGSGRRWRTVDVQWPAKTGRAKSAAIADVDLDGRMDIVLTMEQAHENKKLSGVVWMQYPHKPTDTVWRRHEISGVKGIKYDMAKMVDLDGDGDLDVVTTEENSNPDLGAIWYENPTRRSR